jgi:hypothetical protein
MCSFMTQSHDPRNQVTVAPQYPLLPSDRKLLKALWMVSRVQPESMGGE